MVAVLAVLASLALAAARPHTEEVQTCIENFCRISFSTSAV